MGILDRLVLASLLIHYYCTGEGRYVTRKKLTGGGLLLFVNEIYQHPSISFTVAMNKIKTCTITLTPNEVPALLRYSARPMTSIFLLKMKIL